MELILFSAMTDAGIQCVAELDRETPPPPRHRPVLASKPKDQTEGAFGKPSASGSCQLQP